MAIPAQREEAARRAPANPKPSAPVAAVYPNGLRLGGVYLARNDTKWVVYEMHLAYPQRALAVNVETSERREFNPFNGLAHGQDRREAAQWALTREVTP